ncbi:MAG TPA: ABC transporter permease [Solirubrobacterales bacterium]|nr:ABC transporter permease [Solirubrobacterales bacterium]
MGPKGTTRWDGAWRWVLPGLFLAGMIGAWQLAASTGALAEVLGLEDFLAPSPAEIASAIWENRTLLAENTWVTLQEILIGFALALLTGIAFAVAMHFSVLVRRATYPLMIASQTIPIIVVAPILVLWFGFGIVPKALVVVLVCFFPITVATVQGLGSVDPDATKLMRTLYASRWQIFRRLEAKAALPYLFTGTKIAIVVAPLGAVFGEWVGASSGLGHQILQDNAQLEIARLFGAVFVLSAIGLALFGLTALAERRVVTWR